MLAAARPRVTVEESPIEETGSWEFTSARDPSQVYQVTYGRAGHLECTCKGFEFRGNCKHVREVRETCDDVPRGKGKVTMAHERGR